MASVNSVVQLVLASSSQVTFACLNRFGTKFSMAFDKLPNGRYGVVDREKQLAQYKYHNLMAEGCVE